MGMMIQSERDVSLMYAEAASEQIPLTREVLESGETWAMAVPYRYFFKSALRLHLAFLPVFICVIYNWLWISFTLPVIPVIVFLYARLIRYMKTFSVRSSRLWLVFCAGNAVTAAAAWGIVKLLRCLLSEAGSYVRM